MDLNFNVFYFTLKKCYETVMKDSENEKKSKTKIEKIEDRRKKIEDQNAHRASKYHETPRGAYVYTGCSATRG